MLADRVERYGKGHDRARAAHSDVIAAIRPKIAAAGVQSRDRAGVANDPPVTVERQEPIGTAIEKKQTLLPIDGETARIGNTAVIAEGAERPAIGIEGEKRAISVSIGTGSTSTRRGIATALLAIYPSSGTATVWPVATDCGTAPSTAILLTICSSVKR